MGKRPRPWLCPGTPIDTVLVCSSPMAWRTSCSVKGESGRWWTRGATAVQRHMFPNSPSPSSSSRWAISFPTSAATAPFLTPNRRSLANIQYTSYMILTLIPDNQDKTKCRIWLARKKLVCGNPGKSPALNMVLPAGCLVRPALGRLACGEAALLASVRPSPGSETLNTHRPTLEAGGCLVLVTVLGSLHANSSELKEQKYQSLICQGKL